MEQTAEGYRLTRDEARVVKKAAALTANTELTVLCIHYLGVRLMRGDRTVDKRFPRFAPDLVSQPLYDELISLSAHVERQLPGIRPTNPSISENDLSIGGMRYIYGNYMAKAAIETVERALEQSLFVSQDYTLTARRMSEEYYAHG